MRTYTHLRGRTGSRGGQALILITLNLIFLFAVAGLAIDLGMDYSSKGLVQTQADAAAAGAAATAVNNGDSCTTLTCGTAYACTASSLPTTISAGCYYAEHNGAAAGNVSILANNTSVNGVSPQMWLQATVTQTQNNNFLFLSNFNSATISASATAGVNTIQQAACVYALYTGSSLIGISVTGSSSLTGSSCGVYDNATGLAGSTYPALNVTGSSHVTATGTGSKIFVGGGSAAVHITGSSGVTPSATTGTVSDPLSWLPKPSISSTSTCNQAAYSLGNSNTATISPGIYCGGITVGGSATLTMNGGVYIMNGGGFNVGNSGKVVYGSNTTSGSTTYNGVMIYLTAVTCKNTPANGGNYTPTAAPVSIGGSGSVNLSANTTGYWRGIMFFQDSSHSYTGTNSIANSGSAVLSGAYYFPNTNFSFTGSTSSAMNSAFVANTIVISGSSTLNNDSTGSKTGLTKSSSYLIQ